ncbi:MAG: glucosaminidase domain-containing protein [Flavobacteriaceae bacterium]|nr:glucosaminidase domain-containing protein [Flavobacteriaceae bacterium]
MKKRQILFFSVLATIFFIACHSAKPVTSGSKNHGPEKIIEKKEISMDASAQRQLREASDEVFKDFRNKNGTELNQNTLDYIDNFKFIAIKKMMEYDIPASITLAQGILESGSGRSELTKKTDNHFGIKCHKGWEGKTYYHDDDEAQECFRKYSDPEDSFNDHSLFFDQQEQVCVFVRSGC